MSNVDELKALLAELGLAAKAEETQVEYVAKADFDAAITALSAQVTAAINGLPEMVAKALPRDGQGTRQSMGGASDDVTFENDPAKFLVKKATSDAEFSPTEEAVVVGIFKQFYGQGLVGND